MLLGCATNVLPEDLRPVTADVVIVADLASDERHLVVLSDVSLLTVDGHLVGIVRVQLAQHFQVHAQPQLIAEDVAVVVV